jgi:predicted MPP superfamily phosphohydrolase
MLWVHAATNILMITLDVAWWVIALRLIKKPGWRVLISLFMAAQTGAMTLELFSHLTRHFHLTRSIIDLSVFLPQYVLATIIIWHCLALAGIAALGSIFIGVRAIRYLRKRKPAPPTPALVPIGARAVNRREFLGTCAALAPFAFTFGLAGVAAEQLNHFRLRRMTVSLPSLPPALDGLTIAHVTDIHVGAWTRGQVLLDMVKVTNNLNADVIVMTGDLINYELTDLPEAIDLLKGMQSRYGLWMVEGNHDLFDDGVEFESRVKAAGLKLLLDESDVTHIRGCPVQFFGLRWVDGVGDGNYRDRLTALQMRGLMTQRQPDAFPICLAHHPHAFDAAINVGLPLTLTGHTHGGQLMLDKDTGVGPMLFRYWSGLYQKDNCQLIVSNGVGNMFPIRINAPAEIVHLTLRCA